MIQNRVLVALLAAAATGWWLQQSCGMPAADPVLRLIRHYKPVTWQAMWWTWTMSLYTTPFFLVWFALSTGFSLSLRLPRFRQRAGSLPRLIPVAERDELAVVLGELHHQRRAEPSPNPSWLSIPARGLYTGIMALGAIGSGKTSSVLLPLARQILGWKAGKARDKCGALVLEVKGDFCHQVKAMLDSCGRAGDYLALSLNGDYRYNPLYSTRSPGEQAYAISTLMSQLYGKPNDDFWTRAYTHMITNLILLYRLLNEYVTFNDVYRGATSHSGLSADVFACLSKMAVKSIVIDSADFLKSPKGGLDKFQWEILPDRTMKTAWHRNVLAELEADAIPYKLADVENAFAADIANQVMWRGVWDWYTGEWTQMEHKLQTSIIAGIAPFLAVFEHNPVAKHVFCPPRGAYTDNEDGKHGKVLPRLDQLIDDGRVLALDFPVAGNPQLARLVGTLLKQDWQREILLRIPKINHPDNRWKTWRPVMFLCDEYHEFATAGNSDPAGDERFFAQSRAARCIPIVATQSLSSLKSALHGNDGWSTLVQCFRTTVLLTTKDKFTAEWASASCGREDRLKETYSMSESGSDASVSMLTGKAVGGRSNLSVSKSYGTQVDVVFQAKVFTELENSQAVVLPYDGVNPLAATYCYLRPDHWADNESWWEHRRKGTL